MDAYDIMSEWDRVTGREPRTPAEFDSEVPPTLDGEDYEAWKARLLARDKQAIIKGMKIWGVPIEPLTPFSIDRRIETEERGMDVAGPDNN